MPKVGINGFGRIGKIVLRAAIKSRVEVVAINDPLLSLEYISYLFKYDSTHGTFNGIVEASGNYLLINGTSIEVFNEKDPRRIPWKKCGIQFVIETTGILNNFDRASLHLDAGAQFVIVAAPTTDIPIYVMGVNHEDYEKNENVISAGCSTTACLGPLAKVLNENFEIIEGLITAIHAVTPEQKVIDTPGQCCNREGRGIMQNIIPSSTGAAKIIGKIIPSLEGKLTGISVKVPVANVSLIDLTVRLGKPASYEEIIEKLQDSCNCQMKGILRCSDEDLVSSDLVGSTHSCIVDVKAGVPLNKNFVKLLAWYDNEVGYANRIIDLIDYISHLG